jgi:ABC-2 type transport system ATP-binding protein
VIRLSGFAVRFGGFTLGPLDLNLRAGDRLALVGPNGAGKSTTLRGIAGRLPIYQGSVRVAGTEVRASTLRVRHSVGVLPEDLLGLGWMTVRGHLDFLSAFYPTWDTEYAEELRGRLDVPADTPLADLSRGNRVKLSLVAAEAFRPPVLLLDEPTSGIDPVMRRRVLELVDRCAPRGGGRTVVFSTHILEDVHRIADRVLLLQEGRPLRDTTVAALVERSGGRSLAEVVAEEMTRG